MKRFYFSALLCCSSLLSTQSTKKFHLDDPWYPSQNLQKKLDELDQDAAKNYQVSVQSIRALIAPHAGISYSGTIAAATYRLLNPNTKQILLLAPDHSGSVKGVALPSFSVYTLPNADIQIDTRTTQTLSTHTLFSINNGAFDAEHSLEMHLIFLAQYAPHARVVPLIVGSMDCAHAKNIADILQKTISRDTVVCVSSDFIHYGTRFSFTPFKDHQQLRTRHLNSQGLAAIQKGSCDEFEQYLKETGATICGANPIKILLHLMHNGFFGTIEPRLVGYKTSTQSDREDSVSYIGMAFTNEPLKKLPITQQLTQQEQRSTLQQAHDVLSHLFDQKYDPTLYYPLESFGVQQSLGAFATLKTSDGKLRGCIGRITTDQPLYKTIADVTRDTALKDRRFKPVSKSEVTQLTLKLSILSKPAQISDYRTITIGTHGIILQSGNASAVFLPEVPQEFGWNLEQTLTELATKAGLARNTWKDPKTTFQVFSALDIPHQKN